MDKQKYDKLSEQKKKELLMMSLLEGNEIPAFKLEIVFSKDGLHSEVNYSSRVADLMDLKDDFEMYAKETEQAFHKLSRNLLKKFIKLGQSIDCAVIEIDKSGKAKWPEQPINFSMDLGNKDD